MKARTPITDPQQFVRGRVAVMPDGCWLWLGAVMRHGYGRVIVPDEHGSWAIGDRQQWLAHRYAYAAFVGPIPTGMQIDHLCRQRSCCNPAHLEAVTYEENQRRGFAPPAQNARKTHCKRGHEFTSENTRVRRLRNGNLGRDCRECARALKLKQRSAHVEVAS